MPKLISLLVRGRRIAAPALVLPVLALTLGIGAGAAPASAGITPSCQWQPLGLIDGWRSEQSQYTSGDPSYCVSSGMVYLSGSMKQVVNEGDEFAALPQQAWPDRAVYFNTYTDDGANGSVSIGTDGSMIAFSGAATGFTSLAGLSFPLADNGTALNLTSNWQPSSGWGTGTPSYSIINGTVYLSGAVTQTTSTWGSFATLPPGDRPADAMTIQVYTYAGTTGTIFIYPDGSMWLMGSNIGSFTSLAGVSFPSASVSSTPLPVLNSWTPPQTYAAITPSWYVSDGVVHLYGYLYATGTSPEFSALPQGIRPAHTLYFIASYDNTQTAILQIDPDGTMFANGLPPGHSNADGFSVDGITFHGGS
jgi:hypothetical protein